ncbi:MAG: NUDIX hydrolase [Microgenomates group bacterium Gr01-1014_16]|nr:MAG: NUDIX hydrolase [Microgenomates group bacterium Gr01-1014_16]
MVRTKIRVSGLIFDSGKILLIHRFKNGDEYWTVPGGGVEEGESLIEAIHREIMEETNLTITELTPAFEYFQQSFQEPCPFFLCKVTGKPKIGDGPEKIAHSTDNQYILEWVDMNNFSNLTSVYPSAVKEIQQTYENLA